MERIADYLIIEKIFETRKSAVYRGNREGAADTVIIKVLKTEYPSPSEIARFKHEYNLVKSFDIDGIVKTFDLIEHENTFAIVEEDFDGISLRELLKSKKVILKSFLQIGIKIADTLARIHKNNVIHMDIKPDNILINPKKGNVKITDFGISAILTHANDEIYNPEVIEGTLPYLSPEQTGRMSRTVDYRSDLYSLGVTFYEMLTGSVPFKGSDPMELIHAHIAREPIPPREVNESIPEVLSAMILKLMSKAPEERYQNSLGLAADLTECMNRLDSDGKIENFKLATKDISLKFSLPQILVGRDEEILSLMTSFERVSKGTSEIMLVLGNPGIGKSAMINEIYKPIVAKNGYFISGKYDQFRKDVPYSSIIQAFQGLIRQILAESEDRVAVWKNRLLEALGPNGKIITEVIPELELIIGPQPDVPVMGPDESQNRFNLVFQNFTSVFTSETHPLAIFLDDLQWADIASLKLIQTIITGRNSRYLYLIGAYRDNEVSDYHPLMITLDDIEKIGKKINRITLRPLGMESVGELIANVLRGSDGDRLAALAELVQGKTGGNPFFINQFLKTLYDNSYLRLDPEKGWEWDITKLGQMQVTDNVVEFMSGKINHLPPETQEILKVCSCIGNRFDLELLSIVSQKTIGETLTYLTTAIQEGMISLHGDVYRFHHDRIQEAAYSLISENEKAELHYRIGRAVLSNTPEKQLSDKIFYIVDQLNKGRSLVSADDEKISLARLNLKAGERAKNSSAYASALNYLKCGIEMLPENSWNTFYDFTYSLHRERIECEYLTLNFDEAENIFQIILSNSKNNIDIVNAYNLMIILYTSKGNYDKAVALGLQGMKLVGIRTPRKVSEARLGVVLLKLYMSFWNKKIEDLLDVPMMTDPEKISYGYLVCNTGTAAYYTDANLFSFIVARSIPTLMKSGNYEFAPFMYNAIGGIIGSGIGLYKPGYRFGLLSLKINDKMPGNKNQCRSKFLFALVIQHWIKHARHDLEFYRNAYKDGLESGDHIFAGHSVNLLGMTRIILGDNIDEILEEYGKYADFQKGGKDPFVARNYTQNTQMCLCLKGATDRRGSLNSGDFSEDETIAHYRNEKNSLGIFYFSLDKLRIHYLFGEYDRCLPIAEELYDLVKQKIAIGNIHVPEVYFYYSLVLTALYPSASPLKKIRFKARLKLNQMKMKTWARDCPDNFLHKYLLIEAETAAINMKTAKAVQLFDRAIKSARENRYTQNEAIASERAALFMMKINNSGKAASYLKEAHYGFIRWGATAKVKELEEKFPQLAPDSARGSQTSSGMRGDTTTTMTASGGTQTLDLHAIMKSSQALAGEIDLGKLLAKIMKLSIENAGAQYAYLILENEKDKKLYIEASAGSDRDIEVLLSLPIDGNSQIASSIVNYVKKTGENIVLNNAAADKRFVNDSYIASVKPKSLLCAPIKNKGVMAGILYLENNLTTNAFTPDRLQLLMILSGQAAISIENSRLVAHRENAAKLSTEMAIAANIQDALLPDNPAIEGFDIIAYMKPADDVGGDYYDIINVGGFNWVIIGDVSGHGVPAGLIMMMVQTSIQVVVRRFPETAPSDLLEMVNEAIRYNVGKMKEEKYMTITAFSFTEDGRARHSGLHQDLLIYRSATDSVETIESQGIWLSPWELWSAAADSELHLAQGDVLLLYTDGITEARSPEGEMFSAERLAGILGRTGKNELDQIRGEILDSLNGYVTDDDVTMVILRKK